MKKTLVECDICHQYFDLGRDTNEIEGFDICESCMKQLVKNYFEKKIAPAQEPKIVPANVKMVPVEKIEPRKETTRNGGPQRKVDREKAQELRNTGMTTVEIAKQLGCCVQTIRNNTKPPANISDFDRGKAQALRDAGWTITQIAEEMGCTKELIHSMTHPPVQKKPKANEFVEDDIQRLGSLAEMQTATGVCYAEEMT